MADTTTNASTEARTAQAYSAQAYTAGGAQRDAVALPTELFDGTVNVPAMHQVVKAYLANQRQGTASTKNRRYVTGGNQKPWKQKGTGRARQGSTRAPHWVGGGTVFGPRPRSYAQYVPRKVRALARKSALNARAREGALFVIDPITIEKPKTARVVELVNQLGLDGQKVLILTDGVKSTLHLSARNLPTVHVMPYSDVSTYHVLWSDTVVIEAPALGQDLAETAGAEDVGAEPGAAPAEAKARRAPAKKGAKKAATKKSAVKKAASKKTATKKSAAKKAPAKKSAAKKSAAKKTRGK